MNLPKLRELECDSSAYFAVAQSWRVQFTVHNPTNFDEICNDPGATNPLQGYSAHYCHIPTRIAPTIVACSMNLSGLRVFDITDLANPVETAYFNAPVQARPIFENVPQDTLPYGITFEASNWAMSAPAFAPERYEKLGWKYEELSCDAQTGLASYSCQLEENLPDPFEALLLPFQVAADYFTPPYLTSPQDDTVGQRSVFNTHAYSKANAGHEFTKVLTDAERRAQIEYLKTL